MSRKEFTRAVKVAAIRRATREGEVYCETCGAMTKGRFHIDHVDADGLTGKPVLENARVLCLPCHAEKTKADVAKIARAKRREARHVGAVKPAGKIRSAGFAKADKPRAIDKSALPPLGASELARRFR